MCTESKRFAEAMQRKPVKVQSPALTSPRGRFREGAVLTATAGLAAAARSAALLGTAAKAAESPACLPQRPRMHPGCTNSEA